MGILSINSVEKSFKDKKVVDDLTFSVNNGEIMGMLGPNGAGKTTTIRMIMDIIEPDRGSIRFSGDGHGTSSKKSIGYLPEERGLYEDATTGDVLEYLGTLKGLERRVARDRAIEWLKKMDLGEEVDAKISELSKGMAQKVQFIASILHEPALAILDEPFAGLDPVNQDLFRELIQELRDKGTTILLSSHRMNMVEELCERVFMIHRGSEILYGKLSEIKEDFGKDLVELTYSGDSEAITDTFGKAIQDLDAGESSARFYIEKGYSPDKFIRELPGEIEVQEISIRKPPLHDIFVAKAKGGNDV
ncbi:MAG: ABC transporter ATP-binding protein [Candidatus Bipolaricaulia bacterium]